MLSRRALIVRNPTAAALAHGAARWVSAPADEGSIRQPRLEEGASTGEKRWTNPTDRENAKASNVARNAMGMMAGIGCATVFGAYAVLCYSGDDGAMQKGVDMTGTASSIQRRDMLRHRRDAAGDYEDAKPFSSKSIADQPRRREKRGSRSDSFDQEADRTTGMYNRYVVDAPSKDPSLTSDRPHVKADPLFAGHAQQQLHDHLQSELAEKPSLLNRIKSTLWTRTSPTENKSDPEGKVTDRDFAGAQMRGMKSRDIATADAGSLHRSDDVLPQRAMAEEGADEGAEKKGNAFSRAFGKAKRQISHAAHDAKDRLTHRRDSRNSDGYEEQQDTDSDPSLSRFFYPPPSDETPKRFEQRHSDPAQRMRDEYEQKKLEEQKEREEELEKAAKFNDLEALAGHGHYRIPTKISSEPFAARSAADEKLDRDARILAMENWSVLQGIQVAEQGRRWRARTANQTGVEPNAATGREPLRWFSNMPNEADIEASDFSTGSHGSLERRRGVGKGNSDDAAEKIQGTGTHGDDEAGDTGKRADMDKQQKSRKNMEQRAQNESANAPARPTSVRRDEPMTTKRLGTMEARETIDMRG